MTPGVCPVGFSVHFIFSSLCPSLPWLRYPAPQIKFKAENRTEKTLSVHGMLTIFFLGGEISEISPHHRLSQVKGINSVVRQGN